MSKLPKAYQFVDISDYGRPVARFIAENLKTTRFTPIDVTSWFIICGIFAVYCIINDYVWAAAFFLIFKSILDAADGELARVKQTPSYTGRYYDSVADIILNALFIAAIWYVTDVHYAFAILAFMGIQLQGTLYNYYYVILRNSVNGDTTSRIFEDSTPVAMKGEKQQHVTILYKMYNFLYIGFDKIIYWSDQDARYNKPFPKWFMSAVSSFGLGFQLLVMSVLLVMGLRDFIIPFFIGYTSFIVVFIGIRRFVLSDDNF